MKKLLTILTMLCVAIAVSAAPVTYDLWFDGVQVTSSNANKIHDSWFIKYDANTKTLTLDNIGFTAKTAEVIKSDIDGLTIKVIGTVNLASTAADRCTFAFNGKTTIVGTGVGASNLTVTRNDATGGIGYQPIRANCDIEIKDITMKVSNANGGTAIRPFRTPDDANPSDFTLSVTNANVTFGDGKASYPIYGFKKVKLTGCSLNPMTYYNNESKGYYVADNSGKAMKKDIVIKNRKYGSIGDNCIIDDANASNIKPSGLSNGTMRLYDFEKGAGKYLLLDGIDFTNKSAVALGLRIDSDEPCHFEIILKGNNRIEASLPIYIAGNTPGSVYIKASASATTTPELKLYASSQTGIDARCPNLTFQNINFYIDGKDGGITGSHGFSSGDYTLSFYNCRGLVYDNATTTQGAINHFKSISYSDCYYNGYVSNSMKDNTWCDYKGDKMKYFEVNRGYGIMLKGTDVTKDNKDDVFGDGKVSYIPSTKTLNLKNANIQDDVWEGLETFIPLTVNLSGNNTLGTKGGRVAVCFHANTTITGSTGANLTVNGTTEYAGYGGIFIDQANLTIKDCDVTVNSSKGSGVRGRFSIKDPDIPGTSTLTVDNASLAINSAANVECIYNLKNMTLTDCYFANPAAATFDATKGYVKLGTATVNGKLEILKGYPITVGGKRIEKANRNDVFGDGKVKYDPSTNTLTLNNAYIGTEGYGISAQTSERFYINLIGSSSISSLRSYALYHNNTNGITIQSASNGSLTLSGSYIGSYQESGNLIIKNCTVKSNGIQGKEGNNYCTLNIENANVTSECSYGGAFRWIDNIALFDSYVSEPTDAVFNTGQGAYLSGNTICSKVVIKAGTAPSAIDAATIGNNYFAPAYDLRGVQVDNSHKGIVIQNGRKFIRR